MTLLRAIVRNLPRHDLRLLQLRSPVRILARGCLRTLVLIELVALRRLASSGGRVFAHPAAAYIGLTICGEMQAA